MLLDSLNSINFIIYFIICFLILFIVYRILVRISNKDSLIKDKNSDPYYLDSFLLRRKIIDINKKNRRVKAKKRLKNIKNSKSYLE